MEDKDRKKVMIAARERGPGPGRYALPSSVGFKTHDFTKHMKPAYSFGHRLDNSMFSKDVSPGPKYHVSSRFTRVGPEGEPKYSMLARQPEPNLFQTPGPGTYKPETVHPPNERRAPRYSLSARTRSRSLDHFPAPNMYRIPSALGSRVPNRRSSPSFSISGRLSVRNFAEDLAKTPGPAQYRPIPPRNYKRSSPEYSLGARNFMPGDATKKPGPGAHSPGRAFGSLWRGRSFSMGIRHSEYLTPLIIDVAD
ncbi:ciliary microtubule associated protein 1A-like isoform X2 [Clavelina lepadiformis]|uniref:ciliary microtubule associated protein 1A-like isoform X2 n=1 Tax=Clavelina lepadiformis TaxID=159417 RepID=UPI004041D37D